MLILMSGPGRTAGFLFLRGQEKEPKRRPPHDGLMLCLDIGFCCTPAEGYPYPSASVAASLPRQFDHNKTNIQTHAIKGE